MDVKRKKRRRPPRKPLRQLTAEELMRDAEFRRWRYHAPGSLKRQARRAVGADFSFSLQQIDLGRGVLDPFEFVGAGRALICGGHNRVQVAEAPPLAQVFLTVTGAQRTSIVDCKIK